MSLRKSGALTPEIMQTLLYALEQHDGSHVLRLMTALHPADQADALEQLDRTQREFAVAMLGDALSGALLAKLDENVRDALLDLMSDSALARALSQMPVSDRVYVLENVDEARRSAVLSAVGPVMRAETEQGLRFGEQTAGRLMSRAVAVPDTWSVRQTVDFCTHAPDLPEKFYEIYLLDAEHRPIGAITPAGLLRAGRNTLVADIAQPLPERITDSTPDDEVSYLFTKYHLLSAPVINDDGRLIGVVFADDVVELSEARADNDIKKQVGVAGEDINDPLPEVLRRRAFWLFINLLTAVAVAALIDNFGAIVSKYVLLAAMGPLVAGMGGNAGSQSLAVTVRALATRSLTAANRRRAVLRELYIGLSNGLLFAGIMLIVVPLGSAFGLWSAGNAVLISIVSAAIFFEMLAAALGGILIPLLLKRLGVDPAVTAVVFLTTLTDMTAFWTVLGLASLFL